MPTPAFSRRGTAKLLLAGAAAPLLPGRAAARSRESWARELQLELNDRFLPICEGKVTVTGFDLAERRGKTAMAALVQLDWPPGMRKRRFDAFESDAEAALARLVDLTVESFGTAWPGCFR